MITHEHLNSQFIVAEIIAMKSHETKNHIKFFFEGIEIISSGFASKYCNLNAELTEIKKKIEEIFETNEKLISKLYIGIDSHEKIISPNYFEENLKNGKEKIEELCQQFNNHEIKEIQIFDENDKERLTNILKNLIEAWSEKNKNDIEVYKEAEKNITQEMNKMKEEYQGPSKEVMEAQKKLPSIFISYSWTYSRSKSRVRHIGDYLRTAGFDVKIDGKDNLNNSIDSYINIINREIENNGVDFVLLFCDPSVQDKWNIYLQRKNKDFNREILGYRNKHSYLGEELHEIKARYEKTPGSILVSIIHGKNEDSMPAFLRGVATDYLDFSDHTKKKEKLSNLISMLLSNNNIPINSRLQNTILTSNAINEKKKNIEKLITKINKHYSNYKKVKNVLSGTIYDNSSHYNEELSTVYIPLILSDFDITKTHGNQQKINDLNQDERNMNISLEGLFQTTDKKSKIVIYGQAGVGKSTLLRHIAYLFPSKKSNKKPVDTPEEKSSMMEFDTTLYLPLSQLHNFSSNTYENTNVLIARFILQCLKLDSNIEHKENFSNINKDTIIDLLESENNNILLLLDGFDEVQNIYQSNTHTENKLLRSLIEFSDKKSWIHMVLSSRPSAQVPDAFYKQAKESCRAINIVGFNDVNVEKFINNAIQPKVQQSAFLDLLQSDSQLWKIAHTPVFLAIFCVMWRSNQYRIMPQADIIKLSELSTGSLYEELVSVLLHRAYERNGNIIDTNNSFEKIYKESFGFLKILAMLAMMQQSTILSQQTIKKISTCYFKSNSEQENIVAMQNALSLGFTNNIMVSTGKDSEKAIVNISFVHLSIQEYLAALAFCDAWCSDKLIEPQYKHILLELMTLKKFFVGAEISIAELFLQHYKFTPFFQGMWVFVSNIFGSNCNRFMALTSESNYDTENEFRRWCDSIQSAPFDATGEHYLPLMLTCLETRYANINHTNEFTVGHQKIKQWIHNYFMLLNNPNLSWESQHDLYYFSKCPNSLSKIYCEILLNHTQSTNQILKKSLSIAQYLQQQIPSNRILISILKKLYSHTIRFQTEESDKLEKTKNEIANLCTTLHIDFTLSKHEGEIFNYWLNRIYFDFLSLEDSYNNFSGEVETKYLKEFIKKIINLRDISHGRFFENVYRIANNADTNILKSKWLACYFMLCIAVTDYEKRSKPISLQFSHNSLYDKKLFIRQPQLLRHLDSNSSNQFTKIDSFFSSCQTFYEYKLSEQRNQERMCESSYDYEDAYLHEIDLIDAAEAAEEKDNIILCKELLENLKPEWLIENIDILLAEIFSKNFPIYLLSNISQSPYLIEEIKQKIFTIIWNDKKLYIFKDAKIMENFIFLSKNNIDIYFEDLKSNIESKITEAKELTYNLQSWSDNLSLLFDYHYTLKHPDVISILLRGFIKNFEFPLLRKIYFQRLSNIIHIIEKSKLVDNHKQNHESLSMPFEFPYYNIENETIWDDLLLQLDGKNYDLTGAIVQLFCWFNSESTTILRHHYISLIINRKNHTLATFPKNFFPLKIYHVNSIHNNFIINFDEKAKQLILENIILVINKVFEDNNSVNMKKWMKKFLSELYPHLENQIIEFCSNKLHSENLTERFQIILFLSHLLSIEESNAKQNLSKLEIDFNKNWQYYEVLKFIFGKDCYERLITFQKHFINNENITDFEKISWLNAILKIWKYNFDSTNIRGKLKKNNAKKLILEFTKSDDCVGIFRSLLDKDEFNTIKHSLFLICRLINVIDFRKILTVDKLHVLYIKPFEDLERVALMELIHDIYQENDKEKILVESIVKIVNSDSNSALYCTLNLFENLLELNSKNHTEKTKRILNYWASIINEVSSITPNLLKLIIQWLLDNNIKIPNVKEESKIKAALSILVFLSRQNLIVADSVLKFICDSFFDSKTHTYDKEVLMLLKNDLRMDFLANFIKNISFDFSSKLIMIVCDKIISCNHDRRKDYLFVLNSLTEKDPALFPLIFNALSELVVTKELYYIYYYIYPLIKQANFESPNVIMAFISQFLNKMPLSDYAMNKSEILCFLNLSCWLAEKEHEWPELFSEYQLQQLKSVYSIDNNFLERLVDVTLNTLLAERPDNSEYEGNNSIESALARFSKALSIKILFQHANAHTGNQFVKIFINRLIQRLHSAPESIILYSLLHVLNSQDVIYAYNDTPPQLLTTILDEPIKLSEQQLRLALKFLRGQVKSQPSLEFLWKDGSHYQFFEKQDRPISQLSFFEKIIQIDVNHSLVVTDDDKQKMCNIL